MRSAAGTGTTPENPSTARVSSSELSHNHGTECDASFQGYVSGNQDSGSMFGHIEEACACFEPLCVRFQKKLTDGKMKNIAFILNLDGYWVEIALGTLKLPA